MACKDQQEKPASSRELFPLWFQFWCIVVLKATVITSRTQCFSVTPEQDRLEHSKNISVKYRDENLQLKARANAERVKGNCIPLITVLLYNLFIIYFMVSINLQWLHLFEISLKELYRQRFTCMQRRGCKRMSSFHTTIFSQSSKYMVKILLRIIINSYFGNCAQNCLLKKCHHSKLNIEIKTKAICA